MTRNSFSFLLLVASASGAQAQSTFQNLDFEQANVPDGQFGPVPSTNGVPGWTTYTNGVQVTTIEHNPSGSALIAILGPFFLATNFIVQGKYTVFMRSSQIGTIVPAIAQYGTVPSTSQSLRFWGNPYGVTFSVSFAGQPLQFTALSNAPNYGVYGADISRFAGQTGWLEFQAQGGGPLDNISFSAEPIPEPPIAGLSALGASPCRRSPGGLRPHWVSLWLWGAQPFL
jgi:hypothetical protein